MPSRQRHSPLVRWILAIAVLEIFNAAYLAAFDTASIFYHANVLLHVVLGIPLALAILFMSIPALFRAAKRVGGPQGLLLRALAVTALVFVLSGLILTWTGAARRFYPILQLHVASAVVGGTLILVLLWAWSSSKVVGDRARLVWKWNLAVLGIALAIPLAVRGWRSFAPEHVARIQNPQSPPLSPDVEGGGQGNPFFPSSNETVGAKYLPSDFFLDSPKACGTSGCHPDIVAQWNGSMHHFSSFNNQWYRKSIEYMQDTIGTKSSKWCGGCHDMAILLTGRMDTPIKEQIDTPEAQAGIGCLVCHSIVHVKDTMGQGGFVLEYPEMHRLAMSDSPIMKLMHDYMTRLDPAPHRKTMLKPFHRESGPEFCSSCHKVHLDKPVNNYRWFRGFNEYDAWQQSGMSGHGARSFYYPPESRTCTNCHMPLVASEDAGNTDGFVHSHRFPGANTAVPFANGDTVQLETTTRFLKDNAVTVDIFAILAAPEQSEGQAQAPAPKEDEPAEASLFAGEGGVSGVAGQATEGTLIAPLPRPGAGAPAVPLERGKDYLVEVVTRTRNIGHFFPGGTVDAFDVWVELKGEDEKGQVVYWSGWTEEHDGRRGPVDPSAHFFRSFLLDAQGNHINKRNAWSGRAMLYARLIPPGAADTAHFRVHIPDGAGERLKLTAKVNYRKFMWWNTQWSYAGVRDASDPHPDVTPHYDNGKWVFEGDTSHVSGDMKEIPDLPIIELSTDVKEFSIVAKGTAPAPDLASVSAADPKTRERWNDYGIGLLRQGDLKGATDAFTRVTEIDPAYVDGYVNIARARIDEGAHREAGQLLAKALEMSPDLPRAHYFYALTLKSAGKYDDAVRHLERTLQAFPEDRVVLNQLGRILFLQRQYARAIETFQRTLAVDPEDLQAHYNLMLCYKGAGDLEQAKREEILYARFKADEPAQEITGGHRRTHPYDNNERQLIHEHANNWISGGPPSGTARSGGYAGQ